MADALRAIRHVVPGFAAAARLHLIESNATLRAVQAKALAGAAPVWIEGLDGLPEGPLFLVANEFLDALPVRQFVMTPDGWRERTVALNPGPNRGPNPAALSSPPATIRPMPSRRPACPCRQRPNPARSGKYSRTRSLSFAAWRGGSLHPAAPPC